MRIHTVAAGEGLCPKIDRLLKELVSSLFFHRTLKGCDTTLFPSTVGKDCLMPFFLAANAGGGSNSAGDAEYILLCASGNTLCERKNSPEVSEETA